MDSNEAVQQIPVSKEKTVIGDTVRDAVVVAAIRNGDRERYRELVERYAEKVFAITWCRLGDHDMAEEAAQETFIAGYRQLCLLGHAEKFGSWIMAIARNISISFGIRRRGELRRHKQWIISNPGRSVNGDNSADHTTVVDTIRNGLAELPAIHRECLILFYIEGRNVNEAAKLLGLAESAFKTRLHRARTALRCLLESRVEESLEHLRPSKKFCGGVMLALPPGKPIFSIIGGLVGIASKAIPFTSILWLTQFAGMLPAIILERWLDRKDLENFRDPEGFRVKTERLFLRKKLMILAAIFACSVTTAALLFKGEWGQGNLLETLIRIGSVIVALLVLTLTKTMYLIRNRYFWASILALMIFSVSLLGSAFLGWDYFWIAASQALFIFILSTTGVQLLRRTDNSLFLRAANGLIQANMDTKLHESASYTKDTLFKFAQYLGERFLVLDWRNDGLNLKLRLSPVMLISFKYISPVIWGNASYVTLSPEGNITARLGQIDEVELKRHHNLRTTVADLESIVASSLLHALQAFENKEFSRIESLLGQEEVRSIYNVDPIRAIGTRWRIWTMRLSAVLILVHGIWMSSISVRERPEQHKADHEINIQRKLPSPISR